MTMIEVFPRPPAHAHTVSATETVHALPEPARATGVLYHVAGDHLVALRPDGNYYLYPAAHTMSEEAPSPLQSLGFVGTPDDPRRIQPKPHTTSEGGRARKLLRSISTAAAWPVVQVQLWSEEARRRFDGLPNRQRRAVGFVGALAATAVLGGVIPLEASNMPAEGLERLVAGVIMHP